MQYLCGGEFGFERRFPFYNLIMWYGLLTRAKDLPTLKLKKSSLILKLYFECHFWEEEKCCNIGYIGKEHLVFVTLWLSDLFPILVQGSWLCTQDN